MLLLLFELLCPAGVPDRPRNLMVMNDELSWTRPNNNGRPILRYTLRYSGVDDVDEPMPRTIDDGSAETYDLNQLGLAVDSTYNLSLVAVNSVGESDESDVIMYIVPLPWYQTLPFIVSVSVGGFLIILIFIILFILCCCFCCRSLSAKGQARFGPDYELSRLRALHSHHSAANPNYSWKSRDDYNCTDEDLDLLTKFPRNKLRLENFIDRGEFGEVYQGTALDILGPSTGPTPVAIKILIGQSPEEQRKFLSEAVLMRHFNHLNIVKVLGVCIDNDPIYIIMELMPGGDLLKFLREARRDNGPALLTLQELVQISLDVAQGCRYLEQQRFIHRYIAARNCLVSSKGADRIVKIGNFGLAEDLLYSTDYYQVEDQERLPVRWIAPEALLQGKFTFKSDIWSYGVLLWEIMTLGNQPYHGRTDQEVRQFVTGGGRLERPDNCPSQLYKVMQCCWKEYASERPHFTQIVEFVSNFLDHVNNKRDSYCSDNEEEDIDEASYCCDDEEEDIEEALQHRPSRPSRSSSARSFGLLSLARQGSMRIRNSLRRRSSLHRKEELDSHANDQNHTGMNSEEDLIVSNKYIY
jgi:proto-oncogene tyrosine-protein kinase ROS